MSSAQAATSGAAAGGPDGHVPIGPHFAPKAKQVIYLHMVGGPAQMDLFDYKPTMQEWYDKDLPDSIRKGQRLTTMTSGQKRFPIAPSKFKFAQYGGSGMWVSELLPNLAKSVDDICFIRSMQTDAINHEPAISYMQTGNQITGPALPGLVGFVRAGLDEPGPAHLRRAGRQADQYRASAGHLGAALVGRLPAGRTRRRVVPRGGDPILYINNPPGVPATVRRNTLDGLRDLNELNFRQVGDPETHTRIQQYELAFRMQSSVPELTDLSGEPESTYKLYGDTVRKPGSFGHTVLLARRMVERGTRFVQVYLNNWDTHGNVAGRLPDQCRDIDQPCYGLIQDLKARGLFDETLIIWGASWSCATARR